MSDFSPKILVTGATGKIGQHVVKLLADANIETRIVSRDQTKLDQLRYGENIELFSGDINRQTDLERALDDIEVVFLLYPDAADRIEKEGRIISQISESNVKRVVKLSAVSAGFSVPVSFGKPIAETDRQLQDSGNAWTILRPYALMQNILNAKTLVAKLNKFATPFGTGLVSYIDARDVALAAKHALLEPNHEGKIYNLSGPKAVSSNDIATSLSALTNRDVRYLRLPSFITKIAMRFDGISSWEVNKIYQLSDMIAAGGEANVEQGFFNLCGHSPRSLETFLHDHKSEFE